jgi:hypothetical protein
MESTIVASGNIFSIIFFNAEDQVVKRIVPVVESALVHRTWSVQYSVIEKIRNRD